MTQLSYIVNPKIVYKNFPFVSGTTQTATRHLQSLPKQLVEMMKLDKESFALDIGSNDGTLLKGYLPYGVKFLGVDPSGDPVRIANDKASRRFMRSSMKRPPIMSKRITARPTRSRPAESSATLPI